MRMLLVAALLLLSCDPPPVIATNACCTPTTIQRGFGYAGSFSSDGGATTQVQLILGANGIATVSFVRGGDQVVETFQTSVR